MSSHRECVIRNGRIMRFREWGWQTGDIARELGMTKEAVRMVVFKAKRNGLINLTEFDKKSGPGINIGIRIGRDQHARLHRLARSNHTTVSELARRALDAYIRDQVLLGRSPFNGDAL